MLGSILHKCVLIKTCTLKYGYLLKDDFYLQVPNFPVSDFHKNLKKKHLVAKKSTTDIESMWIDKYKPMCKEEVLGNGKLVKNLKNWLAPNKKNSKKSKKSSF